MELAQDRRHCEGIMVRIAGLEPARVAPLPPQSSASANSAICAPANSKAVVNLIRKGFSQLVWVLPCLPDQLAAGLVFRNFI